MAQLNDYISDAGDNLGVPDKPVDKYDPNGIARISPKESRGYAKLAYKAWVESGMATPWDGTYTDHEGPQDLTYNDE